MKHRIKETLIFMGITLVSAIIGTTWIIVAVNSIGFDLFTIMFIVLGAMSFVFSGISITLFWLYMKSTKQDKEDEA